MRDLLFLPMIVALLLGVVWMMDAPQAVSAKSVSDLAEVAEVAEAADEDEHQYEESVSSLR